MPNESAERERFEAEKADVILARRKAEEAKKLEEKKAAEEKKRAEEAKKESEKKKSGWILW